MIIYMFIINEKNYQLFYKNQNQEMRLKFITKKKKTNKSLGAVLKNKLITNGFNKYISDSANLKCAKNILWNFNKLTIIIFSF